MARPGHALFGCDREAAGMILPGEQDALLGLLGEKRVLHHLGGCAEMAARIRLD